MKKIVSNTLLSLVLAGGIFAVAFFNSPEPATAEVSLSATVSEQAETSFYLQDASLLISYGQIPAALLNPKTAVTPNKMQVSARKVNTALTRELEN